MSKEVVDELDRALLQALQIDGRASFRRLAEVLGVSDQTVARRYARLRSTRALRVVALGDPTVPGQDRWLLRVRTGPGAGADVADALARRDDTSWIHLCSGGTEIVAAVLGTGTDALLLDLLPRTHQVLDVRADRVLHVFDGGAGKPFTTHGPLGQDQIDRLRTDVPTPSASTAAPPPLDALDHKILAVLRSDGRARIEELASVTGASANTVHRRLHDLRAGGALHLDVDVDLPFFEIVVQTLLWLTPAAADLVAAGEALAGHPEVIFAAAVTGAAGLYASVATRDVPDLFRYLTTTLAALPGIGPAESSPALRTVKTVRTHVGARKPHGRAR